MAQPRFQPGSVRYDSGVASHYPEARAVSPETAATWVAILERFLPASSPITVLDLGCGTGRFATVFAERLKARIIGLDASVPMLRAATQGAVPGNLYYAAARCDRLPLAEESCHLAWLSQVIHHVVDPEGCARELRRVLGRGAHVLIRGAFGDRLDGYSDLLRFFPGSRTIMAQFPALHQVIDNFRSTGFSFEKLQTVTQKTCDNLSELAARTRLRTDSTLLLLDDAEYETCQAALEGAARAESASTPVIETIDLLVLRAPA